MLSLAVVWVLLLQFVFRKRRPWKEGDGLFVLHEWTTGFRMTVSFLWMFVCMIPCSLFIVSGVFGTLMAIAETWPLDVGYYYVIANILGLFNPLTNANPETTIGGIIDLVISVYALLMTQTIVGILTMQQFIEFHADGVPDTMCALARYLLVYMPILLFCFGLISGAIVATFEDWSYSNGVLHMTGTLVQLANPIDPETIQTKRGMFIESLCASWNLGFVAIVIQLVSKHPFFHVSLAKIEGTYSTYYERREETVNTPKQTSPHDVVLTDTDAAPLDEAEFEKYKEKTREEWEIFKSASRNLSTPVDEQCLQKVEKYTELLKIHIDLLRAENDKLANIYGEEMDKDKEGILGAIGMGAIGNSMHNHVTSVRQMIGATTTAEESEGFTAGR
jgi:hypothetical protein